MKKLLYIISLVALVISFSSCKKEDAAKDVDNSITKLKLFNNKFQELNSDSVISRDGENSDYETLKALAVDYYESMNKINSQIEEERKAIEKGESGDGYIDAYKKALDEKQSEIEAATTEFTENLNMLK
ncbi:MAG: hypothetical protein PHU27_01330 [Salinivirgaceae bacterium]|jgi:hypothetical protein|nr:hypothetical protein [Salinivirgaceae bacterium]MDD4746919.1 hypothetical protein [Salinivirgaceae bacterium]MDY0279498.1 hypothetical protein [Salinivirgaceae bacterium]